MTTKPPMPQALSGIRAIDFGSYLAIPYAGMMMASLGAEVIKVEGRGRIDANRAQQMSRGQGDGSLNRSHNYDNVNAAKLGVTIEITDPRGAELIKRLVTVSDVVLDNFRPGVMDRLGLGYEDLREVKPDIITLSISGSGATGPERSYRGYAGIFAAQGGLCELTSYPDGIPTEFRRSIDMRCGMLGAFSVLAALSYRQRTGRGQFIDFSAREATTTLIGDVLMDHVMNGRDFVKKGNGDPHMVPHNCYPCSSEGRWVSIAVATDEEWLALCHVTGHPEWAIDERFSRQHTRWQNQTELDDLIAVWTKKRSPQEIVETLQKAGVAAMPSMTGEEVYYDLHLRERGFWLKLTHPELGECARMSMPWKLSKTPAIIDRSSPLMGEHNAFVLGDLLGLTVKEISELETEGICY